MAKRDRSKMVRIDEELAKQIRQFAEKNQISIMEASRQMAKLNNVKFSNKRIIKEIRF